MYHRSVNSLHATFVSYVWRRNAAADMQHHHIPDMHFLSSKTQVIKMSRHVCATVFMWAGFFSPLCSRNLLLRATKRLLMKGGTNWKSKWLTLRFQLWSCWQDKTHTGGLLLYLCSEFLYGWVAASMMGIGRHFRLTVFVLVQACRRLMWSLASTWCLCASCWRLHVDLPVKDIKQQTILLHSCFFSGSLLLANGESIGEEAEEERGWIHLSQTCFKSTYCPLCVWTFHKQRVINTIRKIYLWILNAFSAALGSGGVCECLFEGQKVQENKHLFNQFMIHLTFEEQSVTKTTSTPTKNVLLASSRRKTTLCWQRWGSVELCVHQPPTPRSKSYVCKNYAVSGQKAIIQGATTYDFNSISGWLTPGAACPC